MGMLATVSFGLAALSGAALIAGVLWVTFAQSLWGRPHGPPDELSPEEARKRVHELGQADDPYAMSLNDVAEALVARRWREVWPVVLVIGGIAGVALFLPLGIFLGTRESWIGAVGLAAGVFVLWRLTRLFGGPPA